MFEVALLTKQNNNQQTTALANISVESNWFKKDGGDFKLIKNILSSGLQQQTRKNKLKEIIQILVNDFTKDPEIKLFAKRTLLKFLNTFIALPTKQAVTKVEFNFNNTIDLIFEDQKIVQAFANLITNFTNEVIENSANYGVENSFGALLQKYFVNKSTN